MPAKRKYDYTVLTEKGSQTTIPYDDAKQSLSIRSTAHIYAKRNGFKVSTAGEGAGNDSPKGWITVIRIS